MRASIRLRIRNFCRLTRASVKPSRCSSLGQPGRNECLLVGMGERWLGEIAAQPGRKAYLVPMLRLIDETEVSLQLGQEAGGDLAARVSTSISPPSDTFNAASSAVRSSSRWCRIVVREVPRVFQDLGVVEEPQLALDPQGQLRHPEALTHSAGVWKNSMAVVRLASAAFAMAATAVSELTDALRTSPSSSVSGDLIVRVLSFAVPAHLVANRLRHALEIWLFRQGNHDRPDNDAPGVTLQVQPSLVDPGGGDKLRDLAPLEARPGHQPVAQGPRSLGKVARHHEGIGLVQCLACRWLAPGWRNTRPSNCSTAVADDSEAMLTRM